MNERKVLNRRQFLKATGLSTASVLLAACAPPVAAPTAAPPAATPAGVGTIAPKATVGQATGEFTFWFPSQAWAEPMRDEFNKAGLGITAKFELGEYDSNTKTMAALAAGKPPSVSYLGRWQGPELAVRNAIYALDEQIANAKNFKWDQIWPRLQKDSISWGKKWVLPYTTDTRVLFYNKDILSDAGLDPEKPPKTWDELKAMAVKITKKDAGGRLDRVGFTPSFGNPPTFLMFLTMLWCLGSDMVDQGATKVTITDKGEEAMTYLRDFMDAQGGYEALSAFTSNLTLGEGLDGFSAGKVGLALNGSWVLPNYDKFAAKLNYGMVPGPVFPQYNINANYDGGGGWYFFKQGGNFKAAWEFVDFWMEKARYTNLCDKILNTIPARSDVGEEWAKLDEKRRRAFVATAPTVRWIPIFVGVLETLSDLSTMFDNILIGKKDMKTELKTAQDKMQAKLDRSNSFPSPQ